MTSSHPIHPPNGIDYEPRTGAYTASFDWQGDVALSTAILGVVARVDDVDPVELPPLNDYVDPDALDELFGPLRDGTPRVGGTVRFTFEGHEVTVDPGGTITVTT